MKIACWRCKRREALCQDPMIPEADDLLRVCPPCRIERFEILRRYTALGRSIRVVEVEGDVVNR